MIGSLLLLAATATATAPVPAVDAEFAACNDKAVSSLDFSDCASAAIARADAQLNARWKKLQGLLKDFGPDARNSLLAEERAWIAFKDASCQMYWGSGFGSMHRSIIGPQCRLQIIQARVADLEAMIAALEPEG